MTKNIPIEKVTLQPLRDSEKYAKRLIFIKELLNRDGSLDHISDDDDEEFSTSPPVSQASINRYINKDRIYVLVLF